MSEPQPLKENRVLDLVRFGGSCAERPKPYKNPSGSGFKE